MPFKSAGPEALTRLYVLELCGFKDFGRALSHHENHRTAQLHCCKGLALDADLYRRQRRKATKESPFHRPDGGALRADSMFS